MKKIVSVLLAVVAAVGLCFGVAGCKDEAKIELPQMTADKPKYEYTGYLYMAEYLDFDYYEEFINYYNNYKSSENNRFFILYPKNLSDNFRYFFYNVDNNADNNSGLYNYIEEYITIYDEEIGSFIKPDAENKGDNAISISLSLISAPTENLSEEELKLEFGEKIYENNDNYIFDHYINIFFGERCVATCYYKAFADIPLEWYINYFTENLFYGE